MKWLKKMESERANEIVRFTFKATSKNSFHHYIFHPATLFRKADVFENRTKLVQPTQQHKSDTRGVLNVSQKGRRINIYLCLKDVFLVKEGYFK